MPPFLAKACRIFWPRKRITSCITLCQAGGNRASGAVTLIILKVKSAGAGSGLVRAARLQCAQRTVRYLFTVCSARVVAETVARISGRKCSSDY